MSAAGRVSLDGTPVGVLVEAEGRSSCRLSFAYDEGWLEREDAVALGVAMPLRPGSHLSRAVDAFFENLLPEGCMLEAAASSRRLPPGDLFGLLLEFGSNCAGAVEVVRCGRPGPAAAAFAGTGARGGAGRRHGRPRDNEQPGGRTALPDVQVPVRVVDVRSLALEALRHTVLPGAVRQIPIALTSERRTARSTPGPGRYNLKPQSAAPFVPENEFVTLRVAAAAGVDVVACGLATLADGSLALLTRRFDRTEEGRKLRTEDFCQLAGRRPLEKYDGTAELCADVVRRYTSEPLVEIARLFRRFVVAWWTASPHLHLKNLSLLTDADGVIRLAPAHDLQCAQLAGDDGALALPVNGKRDGLCRADWLRFADSCSLRRPAAERVLREVAASLDAALAVVAASPLPAPAKALYANTLRARGRELA